jgi:hypothetical protein
MSSQNRAIFYAVALSTVLTLTACGNQQAADTAVSSTAAQVAAGNVVPGDLKITSWGPESTRAGAVFNKQPGGSAALWVHVSQSLNGYEAAVEFNGALLQGHISGDLVTVGVPADLYAKPGTFQLHVIAHKGDQSLQSNDVTFVVR